MAFKHFSGKKNLALDLGLSAGILLFLDLIKKKPVLQTPEAFCEFIGGIVGVLCCLFIWSWSRQLLVDKVVRVSLHVICIFMLSSISYFTWLYLNFMSKAQEFSFFIIFILIWGAGVGIKYKRLFWSKSPQETPINMAEKSSNENE